MEKTKIKIDSFKNLPENIKDMLFKHKGNNVLVNKETFVDWYHSILVDNVLYMNESVANRSFDDELFTLYNNGAYNTKLVFTVHAIIKDGNIIKNRYGDTTPINIKID